MVEMEEEEEEEEEGVKKLVKINYRSSSVNQQWIKHPDEAVQLFPLMQAIIADGRRTAGRKYRRFEIHRQLGERHNPEPCLPNSPVI
jgi:hypothetical protein